VAVNELTNKIYVASLGSLIVGGITSGITVIDGATNTATTITDPNWQQWSRALAVNSVTNKIYVAHNSGSNITVIDGATNSTTTVADPNASGLHAYAIAVNPATNKIYVANNGLGNLVASPGNVTVIDGITNSTTTVTDPNAISPADVAVNSVTNKIYVANMGNFPGHTPGNITVIDGATDSTTTVTDPVALGPGLDTRGFGVAVNSVTNKIYVTNENGAVLQQNGGVTVIDGATNSIINVTDPNAIGPTAVAVDSATNKIYVANRGDFPYTTPNGNPGSITVIDGATNSFATIIDPNASSPDGVAVDSATSMVYVANVFSDNVTVISETAVPSNFTLSVLSAGNGSGTVTSNPAGINCGTSCAASFSPRTTVSLAASPASGSQFSGWSTNCTGTGSCNVTLTTSDEVVTATFNALPDFSITSASASLTAQRGGQVTDAITIAPQNGSFSSTIQLSCVVSGPSPMPTCALSPASVTPGANSATSTLTITAPAATAMQLPSSRLQLGKSLYALWLPLVFGISLVRGSKKQRRRYWALGGFLLLLVLLQTACGGSSPSNSTNYTVTVTGVSGTITHTAQMTVTVQ
jgi:DNA-binding beta-propeller fold protein YncE